MGIMTRLTRLCKADIHGVMDQIEDKGLVLAQCLREMEDAMSRERIRLSRLSARRDNLKANLKAQEELAEKVDQDLCEAVKKEKDDIAKFLIRKHKTVTGVVQKLDLQIQELNRDISRLQQDLEEKALVHERLKVQADAFMAAKKNQEYCDIQGASFAGQDLSDEEIQWELEKRKEALRHE
ncbi:phage shock protein A (PspA) family protein [Desulfatibacillum alkenivorans DSM 16219]|uniref:Phage shock protein A (PspA) family protein n=1 Tax=Desulfatibacillum alkenivorans DSM 16219 TaxID=1121393 RepID=A0A1M6VJD9_9BACT|nr:PspA/IM30 family protein [Desulfatibacillum alkenivorans]SHK81622.1 phage shock protein A (PspA) family protein [Desulfatibacillum alkenivorans DSM 16219]